MPTEVMSLIANLSYAANDILAVTYFSTSLLNNIVCNEQNQYYRISSEYVNSQIFMKNI